MFKDDTHWTDLLQEAIQRENLPKHLTLCGQEINSIACRDVRYYDESIENFRGYNPRYPDVSCIACLLLKFAQGAEALERD